jgi:hypothetical protein
MAKRKVREIIVGIVVGGIIGSALSYLLAGIFPHGPVKGFFFNALKVGFTTAQVNLGFFTFSLGLHINITVLTIIFIFLALYLLHRI